MAWKVSIIGAAGTLGACTSYRLATLGIVDELVMIDMKENLLKSHLIDIETAVTGMHDMTLRLGNDADLSASDIVIVAAGAPWRVVSSRMEKLAENIPIIRDTAKKLPVIVRRPW
jgi:malate/lactate dehydrogenase